MAVAHQPPGDVGAHPSEPDDPKLRVLRHARSFRSLAGILGRVSVRGVPVRPRTRRFRPWGARGPSGTGSPRIPHSGAYVGAGPSPCRDVSTHSATGAIPY